MRKQLPEEECYVVYELNVGFWGGGTIVKMHDPVRGADFILFKTPLGNMKYVGSEGNFYGMFEEED